MSISGRLFKISHSSLTSLSSLLFQVCFHSFNSFSKSLIFCPKLVKIFWLSLTDLSKSSSNPLIFAFKSSSVFFCFSSKFLISSSTPFGFFSPKVSVQPANSSLI